MSVNTYDIGQLVRLVGTFTDITGTVADPTTIELKIDDPAHVVTTMTFAGSQLTRESAGIYHYDFLTVLPGRHAVRWTGTGAVQTSQQGHFFVSRNYF